MSEAVQIPELVTQEVSASPEESPHQYVLRYAIQKFHMGADWVTFFRDVLGKEGVVRKTFKHPLELVAFERSAEYSQIQQMLAKLRERKEEQPTETEPTRVITVRLPKSLHESLKDEAHAHQTSMNKLCITKLLQMIDNGGGAATSE